jgi:hypothetical protein
MPRRRKANAAVPFTASDLANITKTNPYIQRLIEDAELRDNVRAALDASKRAYERLANGKAPHRTLLEDRKLHKDLRVAAEALRGATVSLSEAPKKKRKRRRIGRKLMIIFVGGIVALAASEKLRSKVLDTLFGAEEEFQYTPPAGATAAPTAAPVTAA